MPLRSSTSRLTYSGRRSSSGEMSTMLMPLQRDRAVMRECTVRPNFRSPQKPTVRLSRRPFSRWMVHRSARVWVGWLWPPSPALMMGTPETWAATRGAPSLGWRMHSYEAGDGAIDGHAVAAKIGLSPSQVYKTLVTKGTGRDLFVFVIPVDAELDLKKAARTVGEKSVEMIHANHRISGAQRQAVRR